MTDTIPFRLYVLRKTDTSVKIHGLVWTLRLPNRLSNIQAHTDKYTNK